MAQDNAGADSLVRRWQLAESLRRLREAAGLTLEDAGDRLRRQPGKWSRSKVSRIENRDQLVTPHELEQLLDLYGMKDEDERAALHHTAEGASERGWWVAFRRAMPARAQPFISMEAAAVSLRQFECNTVPGLLQTADYTRALINGVHPGIAADEVERRVSLRLARQQVLTREHPPELHVILDESVLQRPIGRPAVMRAQLQRLAGLAAEPQMTIQVLRRSAGPHPGLDGPFTIISLPPPLPDIGYAEGRGGSVYLEHPDTVRECTMSFGILTGLALSASESAEMIGSIAAEYQ